MNQRIAEMIYRILVSGVCPDTPRSKFIKQLLWAHTKGYLLTNSNEDAYVLAYRIPEWDEKWTKEMPEKEEGDILYCAMAVSTNKSKAGLLKILRAYCKENDVKELIYYKRNSDTDIKRIKLRSKSYV